MRCWISFPPTKIAPSFQRFMSCFCIFAEMSVSLVQFYARTCSVRGSVFLCVLFWGGYVYNNSDPRAFTYHIGCNFSTGRPIFFSMQLEKRPWSKLFRTGVMHSAVHLENQISLPFLRFPEGVPRRVFWSILRCQMISVQWMPPFLRVYDPSKMFNFMARAILII